MNYKTFNYPLIIICHTWKTKYINLTILIIKFLTFDYSKPPKSYDFQIFNFIF